MANKFWFGGTGTWDSTTTTHWGTTSGGPTTTTPPGVSDVAVFDGASGGGIVTVDGTVSGTSLGGMTTSAFTGTLDFNAGGAINITFGTSSWTDAATGVHTINMGSGTWLFNGAGGILITAGANLTLNKNTSTVSFTPGSARTASMTFNTGGQGFATVVVNGTNQNGFPVLMNGSPTIDTLTLLNGAFLNIQNGNTATVTNAFNYTGSSTSLAMLQGDGSGAAAILKANGGATLSWMSFAHVNFAGSLSAVNPTNSFDFGGNSFNGGILSGPSAGGGGGAVIGS